MSPWRVIQLCSPVHVPECLAVTQSQKMWILNVSGFFLLGSPMISGTNNAAPQTPPPSPLLHHSLSPTMESVRSEIETAWAARCPPPLPLHPRPPCKVRRLCRSWRSWTAPWRCSDPPGRSPGCALLRRWSCLPHTEGTPWCGTGRRAGSDCGGKLHDAHYQSRLHPSLRRSRS